MPMASVHNFDQDLDLGQPMAVAAKTSQNSMFRDHDAVHGGLNGDQPSRRLSAGVRALTDLEAEPFTYVGCYATDTVPAAFGTAPVYSALTARSPSLCAAACHHSGLFAVQEDTCVCANASNISISAWRPLDVNSCSARCDGWSASDFPVLSDYFSTRRGFCGGTVEWSIYQQYDAVMAVGEGVVDRARGLWWQVVLVQLFLGAGGESSQDAYYNASSWSWHLHASATATGRAAFPAHRELDQPLVGLVLDEHGENPRLLGTTVSGDVVAVSVGGEQPPQNVLNATGYPDHAVDGTRVTPGAAPMAALDESRRILFTAQPSGGETSQVYAMPLDRADGIAYRHIRFVPGCRAEWCSVNELRFRYQGMEVDLSGASTYFLHDLSDETLRSGAILIDFASPTAVDEFSVSTPHNSSLADPLTWVLEGTSDRIRRCVMDGAPDVQSMPDGTYTQDQGEKRQGRPVYRAPTGEILYWDDISGSWWVSPSIRNGGYGAIRCIGDASEPHVLGPAPCSAWNGRGWEPAENVTFECLGNEWTTLHRQEEPYPSPDDREVPLRWFEVSRNEVQWSRIDNVSAHVGLLVADPADGYLAALLTSSNETWLRTLGRPVGSTCSVPSDITFNKSGSALGDAMLDCAATAYRIGSYVWPDLAGALRIWLSCTNTSGLLADPWTQRYLEAATDTSFRWDGGAQSVGSVAYALQGQWMRALEVSVTPSLPAGAWSDGALTFFTCSVQHTCTPIPDIQVSLIPASSSCGCAAGLSSLDEHGFYKVCKCLPDAPRAGTQSVDCSEDAFFTALGGTVVAMGPEPARLAELELVLGQSWAFGISDVTSTYSGVYRAQLEYAAGDLFGDLQFPSSVQLTNGTPPGCGYNPSACDLTGEVFCTLGEKCTVRLNGTALQPENGLKVTRSPHGCAVPLAQPYLAAFESLLNPQPTSAREPGIKPGYRPIQSWDLGRPTRGSLGPVTSSEPGPGVYQLCWGPDPSNVTASDQQYPVEAGVLMMLGPFAMDFECSLYSPCSFTISGIGLASTNKVYLIESAKGRCGMAGLPSLDAEWDGIQNPAAVLDDGEGRWNSYSIGRTTGKSGASHRLCWANDPPEYLPDGSPVTDHSSEFRVEIDPDFIWIRFTAVVDCVVGRSCTITVYGVGMGPTSGVLLISGTGSCGSQTAVPVNVTGFTNPQRAIDPGVPSSTVAVYLLSTSMNVEPPPGFRLCWGPNPTNSSAVNFPLEVYYPMAYKAVPFFHDRVGTVALTRLESDRLGQHKVLALYGDTTKLVTRTQGRSVQDSRTDFDCCDNAGFATAALLEVSGYSLSESSSYVFHDRPVDDMAAAALSVREVRHQGLQCGEACGDDFTSVPTDFVLASGFRDLANPERAPGSVMLLKVQPTGPFWGLTWQARQLMQHLPQDPLYGVTSHSAQDRLCTSSNPRATCAFVGADRVQSMRVVALSPTRLMVTFIDGESQWGTAVVVNVTHHMVNQWELDAGAKTVFNQKPTSHCDVAALSESTAIVAFADMQSGSIQVCILRITGAGNGTVDLGPTLSVATGSLTLDTAGAANVTWKYTPTHRRVSVCALNDQRALVAYGPIEGPGEVALIIVSGLAVERAAVLPLSSSNIDDLHVVPLGTTKKALAVYRDEADAGVAKVQEVDVYEDFNGASYKIGPGSLVTVTSFRTEGLTAIGLNSSAILAAYRAMDGTEEGRAGIIRATFSEP